MKKIISHLEPRHMDDFLAIALFADSFLEKNQEYMVELEHPQEINKDYYQDEKIYLVDIGEEYNSLNKNFDHHHNKNIPCSFVLALKELGMLYHGNIVKIIDTIDRFGLQEAIKKFNFKPNPEIAEKQKIILLADLNQHKVVNIVAKHIKNITSISESNLNNKTFDEFILNLFQDLKQNGLLDEAIKKLKNEKRLFEIKLKNSTIININGFRVVINKNNSFTPFFSQTFDILEADVILEVNSMNNEQISIIKNTKNNKTDYIKLDTFYNMFNKNQKQFIHQTGFICVLKQIAFDEVIKSLKNFLNK